MSLIRAIAEGPIGGYWAVVAIVLLAVLLTTMVDVVGWALRLARDTRRHLERTEPNLEMVRDLMEGEGGE